MTAGSDVWNFTPFACTEMPAPSYAPIKLGSINCSARLPLSKAVQRRVTSSGKRSTENCMEELQVKFPVESYGLPLGLVVDGPAIGVPFRARPKRNTNCRT